MQNKLAITLNLPDDFTGRMVLVFKQGEVTLEQPVFDNEYILTIGGFLEISRWAGFEIVPIADVGEN